MEETKSELIVWKSEERTLTLCGEPVLTLALRWPEVCGKRRRERRLGRYYTRLHRAFLRRWEREVYILACLDLADCRARAHIFQPWQAALDGESWVVDDAFVCIRGDAREVRGDGKPLLARCSDVWRLPSLTPVTLRELVPARRRALLGAAQGSAQELARSGRVFLNTGYESALRADFSRDRFELDGDGVSIFYPQGSIAPAVEGIVALPVLAREREDEESPRPA